MSVAVVLAVAAATCAASVVIDADHVCASVCLVENMVDLLFGCYLIM